jgi:glutathione synthase/RimK-type ligase-like ATP-grasp enzyme
LILIYTHDKDGHADAVCAELDRRSAKYAILNTADIPERVAASLSYNFHNNSRQISAEGVDIDLRSVTSVWHRRALPPIPSTHLSPMDEHFAKVESLHLMGSLYHLLRDAFWVNSVSRHMEANHKPYQLSVAQKVGLSVPKTLVTNDPRLLISFFEECKEQMIYKSLTSHSRVIDGSGQAIFTSQVTRKGLMQYLEQVRIAPCVFQENIEKRVELRVTVIGSRIFPVELDSQAHEFSRLDWRKPSDNGAEDVQVRATSLPSHIEEKIRDLMDSLGLVFGCLDFIVRPDGEHIFLEINPNGQWLDFAERSGLPMVEDFAQMLIEAKTNYGH